ncbi:hypothetical protein BDZ89DRAFT_1139944 [Hymenopellis radicata]|nr:hypothetical protein BDZ89DRAFT_1139944 [Hymenopellis radicata]
MTDATYDPIELPGGIDALFPLTATEDNDSLSSQPNDLESAFDPDCDYSCYPRAVPQPEEDSSDGDHDDEWRPESTTYNLRHKRARTYKSMPIPRKKLTEKERKERRIASYRAYRLRKRKGLESLEEDVANLHKQVRFLAEATNTPPPLLSPAPSMPAPLRLLGTISTTLLQGHGANRLPPEHYRDLRARKKQYRSELERHKEDLVDIVARLTRLMNCSPPLMKMDTTEDESLLEDY